MDYYKEYGKQLNIDGEIWKDITGFDGRYQVSNFGRVKSLIYWRQTHSSERILFQSNVHGYYRVGIYLNKKCVHYAVHRLLAKEFIPNPENYPYINHKNGKPTENYIENLEWCTPQQNIKHAFRTGLYDLNKRKGENNHQSKLTEDNVREIRKIYNGKEFNYKNLAVKFGVSNTLIKYVVQRQSWKHVV